MAKVVFNLNKVRFHIDDEYNPDHTVRASYGQVRLWGVFQAPYDGHMNLFKNKSKIERLTGRLTAIFVYNKDGDVRYFMPDEMTNFKAKKGRSLMLSGPNSSNELKILQREGEEGWNEIRAVFNEVPIPAGGIGFPIPPPDDTVPHGLPLDMSSGAEDVNDGNEDTP